MSAEIDGHEWRGALLMIILVLMCTVGVVHGAQLLVSSDVEDEAFAVLLSQVLGSEVHVLTLEDPRSRFLLGNYWFLMRYDAVYLPDLNSVWSYGGGITEAEWETLLSYVRDGGVLLVGLNTLAGSDRLDAFERGARLTVSFISIGGPVPLIYGSYRVLLNGTYGLLSVQPAVRYHVVAKYWTGMPAVVVMRLGKGSLIVAGFNVVKETVENGKYELLLPIKGAVDMALSMREQPSGALWRFAVAVLGAMTPIEAGVGAFFILIGLFLLLARAGLLPFLFTLGAVKLFSPIVCRALDRRWPYAELVDLLPTRLSTFRMLTGRTWRWYLAVLTVSKHAFLVWDNEYFVMSRDPNRLGELGERYMYALNVISERKAIYVSHLAALLGISYELALRIAKDLARLDLVRLRKDPVDMIVYYTGGHR